MAGAVQANLISSAYFSCEISHCNSGCLSVRKVFFPPEISIITYSCNNFNVLFLQKKKNNICMHQSLSSFVPLAFNFKFMIHAKPFQVKLTITIFDRCQRELFITNIQLSVRTICKFDQTRLQIEMRKLALQVTFSPKPLTVKSHGQFSFFVARYILFLNYCPEDQKPPQCSMPDVWLYIYRKKKISGLVWFP